MNRIQPDTALPKRVAIAIYIANLTQTSTGAPVANVLYNNANLTLTWTRDAEGQYKANIDDYDSLTDFNLRLSGTVICQLTSPGGDVAAYPNTNNELTVLTRNAAAFQDGILLGAAFELKIYNQPTIE